MFVAELMKLFRSKEVEVAYILIDLKRGLMMLIENMKTAPEFHDIVAFLSQSYQQQVGWASVIHNVCLVMLNYGMNRYVLCAIL